jgi:hypothetical protein
VGVISTLRAQERKYSLNSLGRKFLGFHMNSNKKIFKYGQLIFIIVFVFFTITPFILQAQETEGIKSATDGLNTATDKAYGATSRTDGKMITDIPTGIGKLIGTILAYVGVAFFLLMIFGGILWMTARGNETQVTKAKDLITSAVVGLIIVLLAYVITTFVAGKLTRA